MAAKEPSTSMMHMQGAEAVCRQGGADPRFCNNAAIAGPAGAPTRWVEILSHFRDVEAKDTR